MRAILIDAIAKTVTEVEMEGESYKEIHRLIGCECFTMAVQLENKDAILVDDEGLLKDPQHFFYVDGWYPMPLAGKGIIVGSDEEGETVAAKTDLRTVKGRVTFLNRRDTLVFQRAERERMKQMKAGPGGEFIVGMTMADATGDLDDPS